MLEASPQGGITVITDIGVDDALALVLLDRLTPGRRKTIVPTFGNTKAEAIKKNARDFVAQMPMSSGWYYYGQGIQLPLSGSITFSAEDYHGADGLWSIRPPKSAALLRATNDIPQGQAISLGPLTQAYELLRKGTLEQLTLMGGYFRDESHPTIRPQANIRMDIDAAELFFADCTGVDVRVVPHNVTRQVYWTREMVEAAPSTSATAAWLKRLMQTWFENCPYERFALHDPVAALLALEPDLASWTESGIRVRRDGNSDGITELSQDNPICSIATSLRDPSKVADHIFSLVFAGS